MEIHGPAIPYCISIYLSTISIISDFIKKDIRNMKERYIDTSAVKLAQFDNLTCLRQMILSQFSQDSATTWARCNMARAVSRRSFTADTRVLHQPSPCEICSGQSGNGTGFSQPPEYLYFPISASFHHFYILVFRSSVTNATALSTESFVENKTLSHQQTQLTTPTGKLL
jgi:hypothetical protein